MSQFRSHVRHNVAGYIALRPYLIAAAALAALAVAAIGASTASASSITGADQGFNMAIDPNTGLSSLTGNKAALSIEATTVYNGGGGGTATEPLKLPVPLNEAKIKFDPGLTIAPQAASASGGRSFACTGLANGETLSSAIQKCGKEQIGSGYATLCGGLIDLSYGAACDFTQAFFPSGLGGGVDPMLVPMLLFYGGMTGPKNNIPRVLGILHANNMALGGPLGHVFEGTVSPNTNKADPYYRGKVLDLVNLDWEDGLGLYGITDLTLNIPIGVTVGKCSTFFGDGQINAEADWTFDDNETTSDTASQAVTCG